MPNLMNQMFLNNPASRVVSDTDEADWYLTLVSGVDNAVTRSAEQFVKRLDLFADEFASGGFLSDLYTVPDQLLLWRDCMDVLLIDFEVEVTAQLLTAFPDLGVLGVDLKVDMNDFIWNVYCKFIGRPDLNVAGIHVQDVLSRACDEGERLLSVMEREYINYVDHFFEEMDWFMTKLAEEAVEPALQVRLLKAGGGFIEWGAFLARELQD